MAVSAPFRASSKVHSEPFLELSDSFWRDYLETPNSLHYGLSRACGTGQKGAISGASRYRETRDPTRVASFQTVSQKGYSPKFASLACECGGFVVRVSWAQAKGVTRCTEAGGRSMHRVRRARDEPREPRPSWAGLRLSRGGDEGRA